MPIRDSEKHRYPQPAEWRAIRASIMERAGNRCECRGECGDHHGDNLCYAPHGAAVMRNKLAPARWLDAETALRAGIGVHERDDSWGDPVRIVLTIAHLDQQPENCAPENLRALCQRCHLRYDHAQHVGNARKTRHGRKAHRELF